MQLNRSRNNLEELIAEGTNDRMVLKLWKTTLEAKKKQLVEHHGVVPGTPESLVRLRHLVLYLYRRIYNKKMALMSSANLWMPDLRGGKEDRETLLMYMMTFSHKGCRV